MVKYSIITITYNNVAGLERTLKSVAEQSCKDFEYIVIDGGSTDGSVELIKQYEKDIAYWVSEPDKGIYHAMNKGTEKATGEYCLYLNSGDYFHDAAVMEKMLAVNCDEDIIVGRIEHVPENVLKPCVGEISLRIFYTGGLPHQSTFIRRTLLLEHGGYDENLHIIADMKFFMWALILRNCSYREIELCVACFDTSGISSHDKAKLEVERNVIFSELFPARIRQDYIEFIHGKGYEQTPYDRLFLYVRRFVYGEIAYSFTVLLLRIFSCVKKSARIGWHLPLRYKRKK